MHCSLNYMVDSSHSYIAIENESRLNVCTPSATPHHISPHLPHITGMCFTTSSTSSIIIWVHSGHRSSPWCFPQATSTSLPVGKATQSCFPVAGPTSHLKMTRPPGFFFFETRFERKWCTNSKMHCGGWGLETRLQNADTCVSKEPKYRGLDGEDNECRLCKHCGCMLKTDYIWLHKSRKLTAHTVDQKQEINFVWPNSN